MTGLAFVVVFLLHPVDFNNEVNMRQPYPGIIVSSYGACSWRVSSFCGRQTRGACLRQEPYKS